MSPKTYTPQDRLRLLCQHGGQILQQALQIIDRLQKQARPGFDFSKSVGPHLRHIMDHYDALLKAVGRREVVQFDRRQRETLDQKDPCAAQERMALLIKGLESLSMASQDGYLVDQVIPAAFQSGLNGEHELLASSTIGRELLFVNHHAVHHLAILRIYCEQAGLVLSPDLGKAPSTIAHERQMLAVCA